MKEGIYKTDYSNAAYVDGRNTLVAYDLDAAELIPLEMVTTEWLREADQWDRDAAEEELNNEN